MIAELRKVLPLRLQISTLFLFIMWLFFQAYQPWLPIDHDLLYKTGAFDNVTDLSDWNRANGQVGWSDDTGYVSLTPSSRLRFNLPAFSGDLLLCSGKIKADDISAGRHEWDAARILVYFEDDAGQINWSHPHNVGFLAGKSDWQTFTTVIEVPSFAVKGWIELAHYGKSGLASFDDISVNPAVWKKTYAHWQMFFGMTWAAMMMWLVINGHFWSQPWGKAILGCALLIVVGVTLPPATMFEVASSGIKLSEKVWSAGSRVVSDRVEIEPNETVKINPASDDAAAKTRHLDAGIETRLTDAAQLQLEVTAAEQVRPETRPVRPGLDLTPAAFQNFGHAVLFAVLGFLAVKAYAFKLRPGIIIYSLVLFAISTEVLQLVIDGRLFGVFDLVLDLAGTVAGAFAALLLGHIHQLKRLI